MMQIRQSSLASSSYCGMRQEYERAAAAGGNVTPHRLSATVAGSVYHYALEVMQRLVHEGRQDALEVALATFEYYWNPSHTAEICEGPPTEWIARQTWGGILSQARRALPAAYEWLTKGAGSRDILLATEYTFDVPITVDGEEHVLHGTVDRLVLRMVDRLPVIGIDDWKSGVKPDHLQYAMQWSVYGWASTQASFWSGFLDSPSFDEFEQRVLARGFSLYEAPDGVPLAARRGRWLAVKNGEFKVSDCGWRTEAHYKRMRLAIAQYVKAQRAGVHLLTTDTKKCAYCPFHDICGDAPLPALQIGVDDD